MANKIYETLTTPYAKNMSLTHPWDVYPRPQLVRDSYFSLNGLWDFKTDKSGEFSEKILVPFPPESKLSGVERRIGKRDFLIYRRYFTLPDGFIKKRVILHFGAVDQICAVFINGNKVGEHEGGYIPFSFDITESLVDGENEIQVVAKDTLSKKYPYGKQKNKRGGMWYTPISGIWQTVWIESLPENPILSIKIEQNNKSAKITVNSEADFKKLTLKDSGKVYEFNTPSITVEPEEPRLWTPDTPYLYEFTLETETDKVKSYFALRSLEIKEVRGVNRLCLNGKPFLFNGLLDQGYFPDGIFLPATPAAYEGDILFVKRLGFNTLRKHIKIEPMYFYYLADKLGIVIFQDMVNNSGYSFLIDTALPTVGLKRLNTSFLHSSKETRAFFYRQMKETAELLYNSPSVCLYTVFNEGWGQFLPDCGYKKLRELDASRFIDTTSGWFYGKLSDVDSRHIYFKTPTVKKTDGRPISLSEFGGYSLRVDGHLFGENNYGYKLFCDKEGFTNAVYELYTNGALKLIKDGLCALVYTQLSDVEDETNGLITYDRREVKLDEDKMKAANRALYEEFEKLTQ